MITPDTKIIFLSIFVLQLTGGGWWTWCCAKYFCLSWLVTLVPLVTWSHYHSLVSMSMLSMSKSRPWAIFVTSHWLSSAIIFNLYFFRSHGQYLTFCFPNLSSPSGDEDRDPDPIIRDLLQNTTTTMTTVVTAPMTTMVLRMTAMTELLLCMRITMMSSHLLDMWPNPILSHHHLRHRQQHQE